MKDYPVIKYVVFFIVGIVTQYYFDLSFSILLGIVAFLIMIVVILRLTKSEFNKNIISAILLMLLIASSGALYFSSRTMIKTEYPFERTKLTKSIIYGTVKSINLKHEPKLSMVVNVDSINIKGRSVFIKSDFLCNIKEKNSKQLSKLYNKIGVGNYVKIKGTINKPRNERNPGEFDYYKYLQSKDISALVYVGSASNIKILDDKTALGKNIIFKVRKAISKSINEIYNKRTAGLLKGLLLADRSEIDYRVKENFINSGVIHVLAVSGLHVGFIVLIFFFLFSRASIYPR
ncbi:MAG: ComEC family competence protein, partial [Chlorobi bacterium]|nr:ComEC family competence protein [Chlorobiota bacterium]